MNVLFFNSFGRLRSGWRFAVFFGLLFFVGIALALTLNLLVSKESLEALFNQTKLAFVIQGVVFSVVSILIGWLCLRNLENLPLRALGFGFSRRWWKDFLGGSLIGIITLLFAAFLGFFGGGLTFSYNQSVPFAVILQNLAITFVIFIFGAIWEEAVFRGYPLQTMFRSQLGWLGIILTALLFGSIHTENPNVTSSFTFINTTLAGVWLAAAYTKTRNLWFPLGIHWAWNWALASLVGLPVSGITEISPAPLFFGIDTGPTWLTGGHYGIEGGLICTIALVISTILIWFAPFFKADEELLVLTSQENPPVNLIAETSNLEVE